jgi:hypothetical protein
MSEYFLNNYFIQLIINKLLILLNPIQNLSNPNPKHIFILYGYICKNVDFLIKYKIYFNIDIKTCIRIPNK